MEHLTPLIAAAVPLGVAGGTTSELGMPQSAISLTERRFWAIFWRGAMKLLMVDVGRGRYAVAAEAVERIIDPALEPDFEEDPETGEATDGRSRFPVLDLHGATGEFSGGSCVYLLLGAAGRRAALRVDTAEAIRDVPPSSIAPLPAFIFAEPKRLFRGVFSDERGPRLLLDESALP